MHGMERSLIVENEGWMVERAEQVRLNVSTLLHRDHANGGSHDGTLHSMREQVMQAFRELLVEVQRAPVPAKPALPWKRPAVADPTVAMCCEDGKESIFWRPELRAWAVQFVSGRGDTKWKKVEACPFCEANLLDQVNTGNAFEVWRDSPSHAREAVRESLDNGRGETDEPDPDGMSRSELRESREILAAFDAVTSILLVIEKGEV